MYGPFSVPSAPCLSCRVCLCASMHGKRLKSASFLSSFFFLLSFIFPPYPCSSLLPAHAQSIVATAQNKPESLLGLPLSSSFLPFLRSFPHLCFQIGSPPCLVPERCWICSCILCLMHGSVWVVLPFSIFNCCKQHIAASHFLSSVPRRRASPPRHLCFLVPGRLLPPHHRSVHSDNCHLVCCLPVECLWTGRQSPSAILGGWLARCSKRDVARRCQKECCSQNLQPLESGFF